MGLPAQGSFDSLPAVADFLQGFLDRRLRPARLPRLITRLIVLTAGDARAIGSGIGFHLYPPIRGEEGHCGASHARASQLLEATAEADPRCSPHNVKEASCAQFLSL